MTKVVTNDMFDDILKEGGSQYFFHKEDTGEIEVTFTSSINQVEPGDEDCLGRVWNPPVTDANGNPLLDFSGNPREPWAKFEAECLINGVPHVYSFSGRKSSVLKNMIMAMKREEISNDDLPNTTWTIDRIGKWDWNIKYVGRAEGGQSSSSSESAPKDTGTPVDKTIVDALKAKKDQGEDGIKENDIVAFLSFVTHKKADEIKELIPTLIEKRIIKKTGDFIYIL